MNLLKSKAPLIWGLLVIVVSVGVFLYLIQTEELQSRPIFELNYFSNESEIAMMLNKELKQQIKQNKFYWIGLEPEKYEQLEVASQFIKEIGSQVEIKKVIVDQELGLKPELLKTFGSIEVIPIKADLFELGEKLAQLEKSNTPYALISASVYTTSLLKMNPYHVLKQNFNLAPMKISFAYLSVDTKDEKNFIFPCHTEDRTGTSDWGCRILNKSRFARKKINNELFKNWIGLLDQETENDYTLMLKQYGK